MSTSRAAIVLAGRYRLDDWIAVGGMGEVWRATDLVLHRPVAVKVLRAEYAEHPETLARFRAEARHAGALSHPSIAQIYDYGEAGAGHPPFLVMELVDGPPLARLLTAGPLDPARVLDIIAQTAEGLAAAHAAGLVHRDVKPGNLLLTPDDRVKITDFGIAHAAGATPITRTGVLIGTPAYLAPERVAGSPAGPAGDLYSLGIVGYECLAGTPPFVGTAMEIALAHQMRPLPPLPPEVPAGAAALVAELTAKDPAARPADAREVGYRARRLLAEMPGVAASAGVSGWGAAETRTAGAAADARTAGAAADPATLIDTDRADPPRRVAPPGWAGWLAWPRRHRSAALAAAAVALIVGLAAWTLAGTPSSTGPRHPAAAPSSSSTSRSPAARLVSVSAGALAGQPVPDVVRRLRDLGLQVRVRYVRTGQQQPGTVVSVQPRGQVPAETIVTVTGALPIRGHGDGNGHGHGNSDGNGQGGD
jgi:serine/threonine-protein kinase